MSAHQVVQRDERTVAVENTSYKWTCIFFIYALFAVVIYRGAVRKEAAWDLLALPIIAGWGQTIYLVRQKAMPQSWAWKLTLGACLAGVLSFLLVLVLAWTKVLRP